MAEARKVAGSNLAALTRVTKGRLAVMADDIEVAEYDAPIGVDAGTPPSAEPAPAEPAVPDPAPEPVEEQRVPYSRFSEVNEQRARAIAKAELLEKQIAALTGVKMPEPVAEVDPQEAAIRASLERMYPELKRLRDVPFDQLKATTDEVQRMREEAAAETKAKFRTLADTTFKALHEAVSKDVMGGKPLDDEQRLEWNTHFHAWLAANRNGVLDRYASGDGKVVTEYLAAVSRNMLDPARRSAAVTIGARAARTATLPTGGTVNGPVGTPPKAVPTDEDSIGEAAWADLQRRRG